MVVYEVFWKEEGVFLGGRGGFKPRADLTLSLFKDKRRRLGPILDPNFKNEHLWPCVFTNYKQMLYRQMTTQNVALKHSYILSGHLLNKTITHGW